MNQVKKNWTNSSKNYSRLIEAELNGFQKQVWLSLIEQYGELQNGKKVLDVGTGPGFFAIILAERGYDVTAADCTEAMIECAKENAGRHEVAVNFLVADAHCLPFEDDTFDLVVSRNVAWTLTDAESAYREWKRILKPGGMALIFDANWNIRLFDEEKRLEDERDLRELRDRFPDFPLHLRTPEMEEFRRSMPMCSKRRPLYDFELLLKVGYGEITCVPNLNEQVYTVEEQIMNRSVPAFLLKAKKERIR